jgi:hypothetical protein
MIPVKELGKWKAKLVDEKSYYIVRAVEELSWSSVFRLVGNETVP